MLLNRALLQELWGQLKAIILVQKGGIFKFFHVFLTKIQSLGYYGYSSPSPQEIKKEVLKELDKTHKNWPFKGEINPDISYWS